MPAFLKKTQEKLLMAMARLRMRTASAIDHVFMAC
jgi:hypothetical protein